MDIHSIVKPYSPWIEKGSLAPWRKTIPKFHRPLFSSLVDDLDSINQIISITGPRRVGKSTLLQQLVQYLLTQKKVDRKRIVYYSLDDPARFLVDASAGAERGAVVLEEMMLQLNEMGQSGPAYLFLDEIQTLERWEQYLKKYFDLKYPVRIVISGSASSPIFKKSRESFLGRVEDYHVLPFSFREFMLFRNQKKPALVSEINEIGEAGAAARGMWAKAPAHLDTMEVSIPELSEKLWMEAEKSFAQYIVEGGFPEVWQLPTAEKKIEYLFDNQVKKVIYEDLVLATEFRKPEQLKSFYISLLERPGQEVNLTKLSNEIGVGVQQIEKYLPLLEMTDLISHASKFRKNTIQIRRGSQKFYLVDLALRNAVLRIGDELLTDSDMMGLYAENLVFNALRKWDGILQIDYYRDSAQREVDFIVHTRPGRYLPVEVKYRNKWDFGDLHGMRYFHERHASLHPLLITKRRSDFGHTDNAFEIPLLHFLLLFD